MTVNFFIVRDYNTKIVAELTEEDSRITFQCFFRDKANAEKCLEVLGKGYEIAEIGVLL